MRILREELNAEYRGVVIDDRALFEQVRDYVRAVSPELSDRVEYYDPVEEGLPIFERYHVHEQLHKALDRKVWLPSGGSLIIERTEALTVIDVNTGRTWARPTSRRPSTATTWRRPRRWPASSACGTSAGIIVIDFIDMEIRENRDKVAAALRNALARDKTRTQVFDISELGLVEMTRKRISEGLLETLSTECAVCGGAGRDLGRLGSAVGVSPLMYAVIKSGGKQERVAEGQRVRVELLGEPVGTEVSLQPVLVVDGDTVLATPAQLAGASVTAKVVGEEKGPKINAMTYKNKSNQRRRWGHRQHYATLEITAITAAG